MDLKVSWKTQSTLCVVHGSEVSLQLQILCFSLLGRVEKSETGNSQRELGAWKVHGAISVRIYSAPSHFKEHTLETACPVQVYTEAF